jgi:MoxR-like ATPase
VRISTAERRSGVDPRTIAAMDLVQQLAATVVDRAADRDRVLVWIDGPDAAGKTTLADRLAGALPGPVRRISADDFLRPRDERYRRGELSPEGRTSPPRRSSAGVPPLPE